MASTDAKAVPVKNAAYRVTFPILDADGDLVTGATGLDSEVSIDGGTFADCTNEATEIATGSGMYYLDLTAAEMNGDTIALIVKTSSVGAKTTPIVLYTAARSINDLAYPTVSGRSLDVSAGGEAGVDWANVGSPTTALNLSGTNIDVDQVVASVSGAVGSVTGAVGSVTAGVTLAASAVQAIWDALTSALTTAGSIGKLLVDNINATVSSRAATGDAMALTTAERNSVADALLDRADGVETGLTLRGALRLALAALAGKLSGAGTATEVFRNAVADSKARLTATVDAGGNRTAITTDVT